MCLETPTTPCSALLCSSEATAQQWVVVSLQILDEVEKRRELSPALVHPFMRSVMEAPFPAPGRTIAVKSFLPGAGNEVMTEPGCPCKLLLS